MKLFDLSGKRIIVTGATGHLGKALCEGLARAGATLAVASTSQANATTLATHISEQYEIDAWGFELNLTDAHSLPDVVGDVYGHLGRIDCLVNNAYYGKQRALNEVTPEEWDIGLDGTITSAMFMMQACLPYLEASRGNVVNISSMYGMVSPNPEVYKSNSYASPPSYGAGKAALLQLTRYAAVHLASKGIRVNAISPGPFPSPEVQEHINFVRQLSHKVPLGRIGQPEELMGAIVFLASEAASYITGHNLVVDGGWTVW